MRPPLRGWWFARLTRLASHCSPPRCAHTIHTGFLPPCGACANGFAAGGLQLQHIPHRALGLQGLGGAGQVFERDKVHHQPAARAQAAQAQGDQLCSSPPEPPMNTASGSGHASSPSGALPCTSVVAHAKGTGVLACNGDGRPRFFDGPHGLCGHRRAASSPTEPLPAPMSHTRLSARSCMRASDTARTSCLVMRPLSAGAGGRRCQPGPCARAAGAPGCAPAPPRWGRQRSAARRRAVTARPPRARRACTGARPRPSENRRPALRPRSGGQCGPACCRAGEHQQAVVLAQALRQGIQAVAGLGTHAPFACVLCCARTQCAHPARPGPGGRRRAARSRGWAAPPPPQCTGAMRGSWQCRGTAGRRWPAPRWFGPLPRAAAIQPGTALSWPVKSRRWAWGRCRRPAGPACGCRPPPHRHGAAGPVR